VDAVLREGRGVAQVERLGPDLGVDAELAQRREEGVEDVGAGGAVGELEGALAAVAGQDARAMLEQVDLDLGA